MEEITQLEAAYLEKLYRDAEVFPDQNKNEIRNAIKGYGTSVIIDEWAGLEEGKINLKTEQALKVIFIAYYKIDPSSVKQQAWYAESISKLNQMMNTRLSRIINSKSSLGSEMWSLLILGALSMVTFMWFFGIESLASHLLMSSILAATAAFLLFLIYSLDSAFSGVVSVTPEAFERVLNLSNNY